MASKSFDIATLRDGGSIEELSRVVLLRSVDAGSDGTLPEGSAGTVVSVYGAGEAYALEFTHPFHSLVTVAGDQIALIPEETRARFAADLLHQNS